MIQFITILFLALAPGYSSSAALVNTKVGTIKGSEEISRKGEQFYAFRGIRYAKAPTGELRFKAPVPVEPSKETIDATQDGPVCYQPDTLHLGFDGESEDCLWVNVYTRHIGESDKLRPVLVYIHGGAFVSFTGQSKYHGPDYLLDHDIVVVTVNYRLGTLGFFSTGDKNAPGNYGMKDQVEALRWVRDNIKAFGGDPDRVTIAGESAGGASVGLHMLSPMSRGLFHGAMILSGSAHNNWAVDKNPIKLAEKQARLLNCPTESTEEMVECIKKISPQHLSEIYSKLKEWNDHPVVVISPVIEWDDNNGEERFLVKHPSQSFAQRDVADVPVFIGTTRDEFANFADAIIQNKELAAEMSANWTTIAPIAFTYEPNDHISNELQNFYLGSEDQPIKNDPEIRTKLGQLFADSVIIFGVVRSAKLLAATNSAPVYLYQFNFQGKYSGDGVYHSSEMDYLFFNSLNHTRFDTEGEDAQCVDRLTSLWKNFVETGNPTPEPEEVLNKVIWTPYTDENPAYLDINKNLTVVEGLYFEQRMSFWESLFPLSNGRTRSGMTRAGGKGNRAEGGGSGGRNRWWWWFG